MQKVRCIAEDSSMWLNNQMYTKDGPSLPVDCQLRITLHLATFHALLVLRYYSNDLFAILHLSTSGPDLA